MINTMAKLKINVTVRSETLPFSVSVLTSKNRRTKIEQMSKLSMSAAKKPR
jgi:hypothetical protein